MNQNEQDNKPERTAMQEMIDHLLLASTDLTRFDLVNKAIELRDTVEKDQRDKRDRLIIDETWIHVYQEKQSPSTVTQDVIIKIVNQTHGTDGK